jgi:hypothetical protein
VLWRTSSARCCTSSSLAIAHALRCSRAFYLCLMTKPASVCSRILYSRVTRSQLTTKPVRVRSRVRQGADPNSIDDGGSPALALAVTNKCPLPLLQALLLAGADPDAAGPTGSPLQVRAACAEWVRLPSAEFRRSLGPGDGQTRPLSCWCRCVCLEKP